MKWFERMDRIQSATPPPKSTWILLTSHLHESNVESVGHSRTAPSLPTSTDLSFCSFERGGGVSFFFARGARARERERGYDLDRSQLARAAMLASVTVAVSEPESDLTAATR